MIKDLSDLHPCCSCGDVMGCEYHNVDDVFILTANGDNNFLYYGIAKNSLLFVKPSKRIKKGSLMVFLTDGDPKYKLSTTNIKDAEMVGRVLMTVNQYE